MALDPGNHYIPKAHWKSTPTSSRQSVLSSLRLRSRSLAAPAKSPKSRRGHASSKAALLWMNM